MVAYGLLLFRSGFYWDDWESVYLYSLHNPGISFQYFSERPFSTIIYLLLFPITRMSPQLWWVVSLLLRWVGVLGIYYTLEMVWPGRTYQNRWTGLLIFVFPAFLQQPVALCYSRHFTSFALFGISLLCTVKAIKNPGRFWLWFPLAVGTGLLQIFNIEYFATLEFIRPLIIWFTLRGMDSDNVRSSLKRTLLLWLPFIIGMAVYFWWQFFELPRVQGIPLGRGSQSLQFYSQPAPITAK